MGGAFLRQLRLERHTVPSWQDYPFSIPAVGSLDALSFHPGVTFLAGENGSGKSTLIEALALAAGYNPEGGPRDLVDRRQSTESVLHDHLVLSWRRRPRDGFFLRAETFFNVASSLDLMEEANPRGRRLLHEQSHGESFLSIVVNRFGRAGQAGLYLLDEPESAFSFQGCLGLLAGLHELTLAGSQFVIATHSAVLLSYPHAIIYQLNDEGLSETTYQDTDAYRLTRSFLEEPDRFLRHLFSDDAT